MVRTQVQIDEDTYEAIRLRAHNERKSMSSIVREVLRKGMGLSERTDKNHVVKFKFVGSGASGRSDISVHHDEALAEDFR